MTLLSNYLCRLHDDDVAVRTAGVERFPLAVILNQCCSRSDIARRRPRRSSCQIHNNHVIIIIIIIIILFRS